MANTSRDNTVFLTDETGAARAFRLGGKTRRDIYELKPTGLKRTDWKLARTLGSWHPLHAQNGAVGPLYRTRREVLRYVAEELLKKEHEERVRQAWREKRHEQLHLFP